MGKKATGHLSLQGPWVSILLDLLTRGEPALHSLFLLFFSLSYGQDFKKDRKSSGSGTMLEADWTSPVELAIRNHSSSLICPTKPAQEQLCSLTCLPLSLPQPPAPSLLQNPVRLKTPSVSPSCPHKHFGKILLI